MGRLELRNVKQVGKYLYFRREIAGKDSYIRLPALDDPAFAAEYERLSGKAEVPARPTWAPGSIGALVVDYRGSDEFRSLAGETRKNYNIYLDLFLAEHGTAPVRSLTTPIVYAIRDGLKDRPGKANNYVSILGTLIAWGIPRGYRGLKGDNPCDGVPRFKLGEHKPWPAELVARTIDVATPRTRLAIVTGLCSGQRIEDCIVMRRDMIESAMMTITQQKTRKQVYIPMHPMWVAEIDAQPGDGESILVSRFGRPYASTDAIQDQMRELMATDAIVQLLADLRRRRVIGEKDKFTFHGLRKNSTNFLAEIGLTPHQIQAINGMSLEMIEHYTKGVHSKRLAQSAASAVTEGRIVTITKARETRKIAKPVKQPGNRR